MSLQNGRDIIMTTDYVESMKCPTCDEVMAVTRGAKGATSYAEAMSGGEHVHDTFVCRNAEKDWHRQVLKLQDAIDSTPSGTLAQLYRREIKLILETKKATKEVSDLW